MKQITRWLCAVLAVVMLGTMCACKQDYDVSDVEQQENKGVQNRITGLYDMGETDITRPVGVMVANNDFIQDEQVGIGQADMWVECETEGGITRLMAVFASSERVPESIGPIRSARSPFFHVVEALGLAYAHAGGSYTALDMIAASNIADLDLNTGSGSNYSWRDESYPHDYEYTLRTSGEKLTQYMNDQGYKQYAVTDFPWTFGEIAGQAATDISVKLSGAQTIGFTYDSATGVYAKTNGSYATPHVDIAGNPITASNVLLLYSDKIWENETTIDFALQSGTGYVFSNGSMRRFNWTRDANGFTMTETDGTTLVMATGKTYMCVVDTEYEGSLTYTAPVSEEAPVE